MAGMTMSCRVDTLIHAYKLGEKAAQSYQEVIKLNMEERFFSNSD